MESISKLTTKFIKITNAIKHADKPREFMLYRSMLTADELETLNYVQNIMNCCEPKANSPPTVDVQPIPEKKKRVPKKKAAVEVSSSSCEEVQVGTSPTGAVHVEKHTKKGRKKKDVVEVSSSSCEETVVATPATPLLADRAP